MDNAVNAKIIDKLYDQDFRRALRQDAKVTLQAQGWQQQTDELEIIIKTNTPDLYYLVIPYLDASNIKIDEIQAGVEKGSASTAGTLVSTVFTLCDTLSTLTSLSSGGTAQ